MSSEQSHSDGEDEKDHEIELSFDEIIGGIPLEQFLRDCWGRAPLSTTVSEPVLHQMRSGMFEGDLEQIARRCRKDDNSKFSAQEIEDMENQLEEDRRTVNLPFCYTKTALAVKQSFLAACSSLGNDVEVGVYISRGGGAPAAWHFDNNHNITVQIFGSKEWLYTPGPPLAMASRALTDAPMDAVSQSRPIPSTSPSSDDLRRFSLLPGSVLYVPPGHWHSVIPANGGRSLAIDLRVATIPRAKWIAEALFAVTALGIRGGGGAARARRDGDEWDRAVGWGTGRASELPVVLGPDDWDDGGTSAEATCQVVRDVVGDALRWCRPPRALPFEADVSDGMQLGGRLSFLQERHCCTELSAHLAPTTVLRVNPMVTVSVKERGGAEAVVSLRSLSSLTASEYLRYDVLCSAAMLRPVKLLAARRRLAAKDLWEMIGSNLEETLSGKKRKSNGKAVRRDRGRMVAAGNHDHDRGASPAGGPGESRRESDGRRGELKGLLGVLVFAHVVVLEANPDPALAGQS